jgi:hypothetical protein
MLPGRTMRSHLRRVAASRASRPAACRGQNRCRLVVSDAPPDLGRQPSSRPPLPIGHSGERGRSPAQQMEMGVSIARDGGRGRAARPTSGGETVLQIRHESPLVERSTGTSLNVPPLCARLYPVMYPLRLSDTRISRRVREDRHGASSLGWNAAHCDARRAPCIRSAGERPPSLL